MRVPRFTWLAGLSFGMMLLASPVVTRADIMLPPSMQRLVQITDPKSVAAKAIEEAQAAIAKRDINAARLSLQSLATDPNVVHSEILLSELLIAAGFASDGRAVLEEFSSKEPQRADLLLAFCELAVREQRWFDGWTHATIGEKANVPEHWSPEFRQQVQDRLRMLKAVCSEGRKDWKGAQDLYTALSPTEKPVADALAGLGRTSFHLGDTDAALGYFVELKKLKPETEPPHLLLAQLHDMTGQTAKAESSYEKALKTATGIEATRVRLAFARWRIQNNQPKPTADLLSDAIKDSPELETERQFLQALVARMEGRLNDAQKILSPLHQQNPTTFVFSNQLALVLCQNSDESLRARALQIAEGNVRNLQRSSDAWATLGWVQLQLGDLGTAEKSLANVAQLGPLNRDAVYYVWQLKRQTGETKDAELLEKAFTEAKGPNYFDHSR